MAKFKGITGNKVGRLGNEIYYMNKSVNLIRSAPTHVYDPKSRKQMIQRIKMVNTQNGYKYIQQFNDLDLFPDKKELENQQNAFVRFNIENALLVPKVLCKKKYVPMFTLDLMMSNGTFARANMNYDKNFDEKLGLVIDSVNPQGGVATVGDVSRKIIRYYSVLENGDKIVFYQYGTKDIEYTDEEGVIVRYTESESLTTFAQRKTFTINTNDNNLLFNEGFYCSHDRVLCPMIENNVYSWIDTVETDYVAWITATFIKKPNTEQQRIGTSGYGYTTGYFNICEGLSSDEDLQEQIIEEWGANMNYNIEL